MAQVSYPSNVPVIDDAQSAHYEPIEMPPFDPKIHLAFQPPILRHSFTELGLSKPASAPDVCFSEPFQLFSEEGIRMIRRDLLRPEVLDKHFMAWDRAPGVISGAEVTATWIKDLWYHPEVIRCVSEAFGTPLKPLGRLGEVGYVNVQLGAKGKEGVYLLEETPSPPLGAVEPDPSEYDDGMIDSWHRDSTQVVCVVMLSDTSTMIGGETAIRLGDGRILKARGGKAGTAVMMQGGNTLHAALRATNAAERISMVTSYSFVDPDLDDSRTSLRSISPKTHDKQVIDEHFLMHKLAKLKERVEKAMVNIEIRKKGEGLGIKREEVEPWVEEQITFLKQTSWELFERYPKYLYKDVPEDAIRDYLSPVNK